MQRFQVSRRAQTVSSPSETILGMETTNAPRIVHVDRMSGGIAITFEDGRSALFTAPLLYATLPQAFDLDSPNPDDEGDGSRASCAVG
jgi:hypothetical protein